MQMQLLNGLKRSFRVLFVATLLCLTSYHAMAQPITLNAQNQTIRQILRTVEKDCNYRFFYSEDLKDLSKKVTIKVNKVEIGQFLDKLFDAVHIIVIFKGVQPFKRLFSTLAVHTVYRFVNTAQNGICSAHHNPAVVDVNLV